MAQFDDIKAGDQVVITEPNASRRVAVVERVTATQFVADDRRFTKYGCKVGDSNKRHSTTARSATPELLVRVAAEQRYANAMNAFRVLEEKLKTARHDIFYSRNSHTYTDAILAANAHLEQALALLTPQENHDG
jgi:hypothetical protein